MSIDCKATVAIGEVSRGGLTRGDYRACDHDLGLHEKYIPCGIVEEDSAQLRITFGSSFKTSWAKSRAWKGIHVGYSFLEIALVCARDLPHGLLAIPLHGATEWGRQGL